MKKSSAVILALMVGIICIFATLFVTKHPMMMGNDSALSLEEFMRVEQMIDHYYLRDYDIEAVQYAGLKAMVASLGDPYSVYYTPEEFEAFNHESAGEYSGLGMGISTDEVTGLAIVSYFMEGSSAQEAGVQVGDLIISIDGQDVTGKTLQEIAVLCIGEEGTPISMGVKRGDTVMEFQMLRQPVSMNMVEYAMQDDGIGYMRIKQFGGNCEALFHEGMDYFEEQGAKGVIFDLRNNPGGYLTTVVSMLDRLLPEGTLVYTEDKYGNRDISTSGPSYVDIPLVLIVNGHTASASEIFAGAVQDYGFGEVVGTRTYGKGVVQVVLPIPSTGGGMKITSSEYFTPKGRSIDGNGIYPDHFVELTGEGDAQMNKAQSVLRAMISAAEQQHAG